MSDERKQQNPVKIVLQDIQTKPLSNGYNAIIKGTGDMTKGKEYYSKWFSSEFEANKALETLAEKNGCVVSIDKWHIKGSYQNWEEYTLHDDEEPPAPPTQEERIQESRDELAENADVMRECMLEAHKLFNERYPTLKAEQDSGVVAKILEYQQKIATSLFISLVKSAGYK